VKIETSAPSDAVIRASSGLDNRTPTGDADVSLESRNPRKLSIMRSTRRRVNEVRGARLHSAVWASSRIRRASEGFVAPSGML